MKRIYFSKLLALVALLLGFTTGAFAQPVTFTYSGGISQSYTVPPGVSTIQVDMAGAQGGNSSVGAPGGLGGRVVAVLNVSTGQVYNLFVGNAGANYGTPSNGGANGNGGGAQGGNGNGNGAGGGGATDMRFGGIALANRILVAGGGGGAGYNCAEVTEAGGVGGGLTGGQGWECTDQATCHTGGGGTQTGAGTTGANCTQVSNGTQANGAGGAFTPYVGGGGGGYFGGGAGYYGGGGGGSSFPAAAGGNVTAITHTPGFNTTSGYITITALVPTVTAAPASLNFGVQTVGVPSVPMATALTGVRLMGFTGNLTVTAPIGYQVSTDANPIFANTVAISYTSANLGPVNLYVQFNPTFATAYCGGVITVSGGGQPTPCAIPVCGTGVAACSALPTAGTAVITPTTGGSATPFTLSLTGASVGGSIGYQWQSAPSATGPWTDMNGAITSTYSFLGITANTWFRCNVTCPSSGTATSTVTSATFVSSVGAPPTLCTAPVSNYQPGGASMYIVPNTSTPLVMVGEYGTQLSDAVVSTNLWYYDETAAQTVTLLAGNTYTMTNNSYSRCWPSFQVWIDFNNNGTFDPGESVGGFTMIGAGCISFPATSIVIPATGINPGNYRMRVELAYNGNSGSSNYPYYPNINPCSNTTQYYTETRDYTVIISGPRCVGNPEPGIVFDPVATSCGTFVANSYGIGAATGNGISNVWQSSPDNITWTTIGSSANQTNYSTPVSGVTYIRNTVNCAYGGTSTSGSVKLTANPQPLAITGSNVFCSGTPTPLSDATPGGVWTSSNMAAASIGSSSGIVTGTGAGTSTISYTLPAGCFSTMTVTVYLTPAAITGPSSVCTSQTIALSSTTSGGSWTSQFPFIASVGSTGTVTGSTSGNTVISYTIPTGSCYATYLVSVNTLPAPITGTASVCEAGSTTTLSESLAGGTWSSTIIFDATVSSTGVVTGLVAGNPNIVYTMPGGCAATRALTVNPLPAAISGASSVCMNATTTLSDATGGGGWTSTFPTVASVSGGLVTGLSSGSTTIKYTIVATGCSIGMPLTVNPLPAVKSVTGGGGYCVGGGGSHIGLSGSDIGINYQLYQSGVGSIGLPVSGTSSGFDFGVFTATGVYTVQATDNGSSCTSNMSGSATISINPLPNPYTPSVVGTGFACAGSTGVDVILSGSDAGVYYQLWLAGVAVGAPVLGTGVGTLDLGFQTAGGTYTVVATNATTLCTANMPGSATVNINPAPSVYAVLGGGSYCQGDTGVHISLSSSFGGVDYKVYTGGVAVNNVPGTGTLLDLGLYTTAGSYTVVAMDITSGCTSNMTGSALISINPLPIPEVVTGGGNYCQGASSPHVGLANSVNLTKYQLYMAPSIPVGSPVLGSNSALDFGAQTSGTYTVIGTNTFGCNNNMTGSVTINMNTLPSLYSISSGAGYCAGGTGVDVTLGSSDVGVNYQLYNSGVAAGLPKPGTGSTIDFGNHTAAGTYTITGVNATTGCVNVMSGSAVITINPLPLVFTVSGGGNFCAGTGGRDVILSGSETGVSYQPYVGGVLVGSSQSGTGSALTFAGETTGGNYTIVATNSTTGCTSNMAGSTIVTVDPAPFAYTTTVTGGGNYCVGGSGQRIGLSNSTIGVNYQVWYSGSGIGSILGGTGHALDFGLFTSGGSYTILATNATTGCTNTMGLPVTITANIPPTAYTVTAAGTGAYCFGGAGVDVDLSGSTAGISYQLYLGSSTDGLPAPGTGSPLVFAAKTIAGTYTVIGTDPGTGCQTKMTASANVSVNPAPKVYAVTGGGTRCSYSVGDTIGLGGSEFGVNYQVLHMGNTDGTPWAGTNLPIYLGLHDTAGAYTVVATNPSTGCTSNMSGSATINVNTAVVPAVNILIGSGSDTVCDGKIINFTAIPSNGGVTPFYVWQVNGTTSGSGSTLNYKPANGDIVSVFMTSNAVCPLPATVHNTTTMSVNPSVLPSVTIAADKSGLICPNTHVTLTATPTTPGTTPSYQWIRNSLPVGAGATYAYTATTNDIIFVELMSSYQCRTSDLVLSNNIIETMNEPILPMFTIGANPGTTIRTGETITLTANIANTTGAFTYQWYLNGVAQPGQTNPTYVYSYFSNDDVVKCVVTSVGVCGGLPATESTLISVLATTGVGTVNGGSDIRVMPNPNKGAFTVKGTLSTTADEEVTLEITNMLGQVVYNNKVMATGGTINEQIQLSNTLANGMYILNVRSGGDTKAFHFVIEQ